MAFADKELTCRDCSKPFIFTGGEQEFYASKGLQNEPVRCPPCRSARKSNRLSEPEEGYVRYGVFASFGGRTPRQMHPATCADCGMMTEVPFQPRGDRPVYCSACYTKIKGAAEGGQPAPKAEATAEGEAEKTDDAADASSDDEVKAETEATADAEGEAAPAAEAEADGAADASSEEEVQAEEAEAPAAEDEASETASEDEGTTEPVAEEASASG